MQHGKAILWLAFILMLAWYVYRMRRRVPYAFGTAQWASGAMLRGMSKGGLVLGRIKGKLLYLPRYCHVLLIGSPGSGKGVSFIIPNLLTYKRSVFCFDTKGDLFKTTAEKRQRMGQKVVLLAPFKNEGGCNPLDTIAVDSPTLVDSARAMAEALVVRTGMEHETHWNDKAVQVITAVLVLILLKFRQEDRNLNTLQDIASDPPVLFAAAAKLSEIGGIPARLGAQLKALFAKEGEGMGLTREGFSVVSTVARHLSFLDSDAVSKFVAKSSFEVTELLKGLTVYVHIPPDQLEAQKGLLRCLTSTFIRVLGAVGDENKNEMLFMIDEASALGSLAALKEALVRGRSAGIRVVLAYQSNAQVEAAFKDEETLLYDNCSTHIYLGAASYETAERISLSLGEYTEIVQGCGENQGRSTQDNRIESSSSRGSSVEYSQTGRRLMKPEEILSMSTDYLIAFVRGMAPILAKRVKWYEEPEFTGVKRRRKKWMWFALAAVAVGVLIWLKMR